MEYGLGIDFGTTYSAAAIATARGVEICTLGTRAASIPTAVLIRADGEVLVGEAAERRAVEEPDRAAFAFKRRLGDPTPLVLGGTPYGADTLVSYVLAAIVRQVVQQNGGPPAKIVITHPAPFGDYKIDQLRLAAQQADIGPVSFITEPEAAAVHYSTLERIEAGQVVAVYDFGGGTFDAAMLRRTADRFALIGHPEGLERIGGIDLDHAVLQHVLTSIGRSADQLATDDPDVVSAMARLRDDCRAAKEALSADADVTIPVGLPNLMTHVRLTRVEFEAMIRPRIADTIEALGRAVRSAGLAMEDVSRILLVGGSSRIPLVREMVAAATGRPVSVDVHPKHSVAMGAATLARQTAPFAAPGDSIAGGAGSPLNPGAELPPTSDASVPTAAGGATGTAGLPSNTGGSASNAGAGSLQPGGSPDDAVAGRSPSAPGSADRSKRTRLVAIGAVVAVVIAAAVVFLLTRGDDAKDSAASSTTAASVTIADTASTDVSSTAPEATDAAPASTTPTSTDTGSTDTPTTAVATTAAAATETPLFIDTLPRATTYGILNWSVDNVVVRYEDPTSFDAGLPPQTDATPWGYLNVSITSPLLRVPVTVAQTPMSLILADGTEVRGGQFDSDGVVAPGATVAVQVAFELGTTTDLAGATLRIGDDGDEPATIALDGEQIAPPDDRDVSFDPLAVTIADAAGNPVDWGMGPTSSGIDSYYDSPDGVGGQTTAQRRAGVGMRLMNMSVTVTGGACTCTAAVADTSMVRLVIDGTVIPPSNSFSYDLAPGASVDEGLIFEYPATATTGVLQFGPADVPESQQSVTVTFS